MENETTVKLFRSCITPFSTRTKRFEATSETIFMVVNISIYVLNIISASLGIHFIRTTPKFKRKYCLWLMYNLHINDLAFTLLTQTLYSYKLFTPRRPCVYDIISSFITLTLADTSLCLVMATAIIRLVCTKYLLKIKLLITKRRSRLISLVCYLFGAIISSIMSIGAVHNNIYLIHISASISAILFPIVIPLVYFRALVITRNRRLTSCFKTHKSLTEIALFKGMISTLSIFALFRLPYFLVSTYKMVYIIRMNNDSNFLLQLTHSLSFLIFCGGPIGNLITYFLSDRTAWRRFQTEYNNCVIWLLQRTSHSYPIRPEVIVNNRN